MLLIYTFTILISATLLFLIEPMFARMVLPLMGGSAAVWNSAVVFYQIILLLGYIYAHYVPRWLGLKRQAVFHLFLILLPLTVLPIRIPPFWTPPTQINPIPALLLLLTVSVGLPFFVISASSPLLQKWFENSGHVRAKDPYFLYAASNVGSMSALLAYPFLIEPFFKLQLQSKYWSMLYGLFVICAICCAWFVLRSATEPFSDLLLMTPENETPRTRPRPAPLSISRKFRWVLWAFVPSSLMLSVTTYFSTEITPIPLFWVIPLAVYLLTFIFAFAAKPLFPLSLARRLYPLLLLPLVLMIIFQLNEPVWLIVVAHLTILFLAGMVCHGALAEDRPHPGYLTEFYLWLSIGGAIGGIFNALLAPLLFHSVIEYPLILVVSCLTLPLLLKSHSKICYGDFLIPAGMGIAVAGLIMIIHAFKLPELKYLLVLMGLAAVFCFSFSGRPIRFALGIGAIFLASALFNTTGGQVVFSERNFFGINRVIFDRQAHYMKLVHGNTIHGMESTLPGRRNIPLTYYYPTGPMGQFFAAKKPESGRWRIAAVGLGAGSLSCYSQPGQQWTYYEIDPAVVKIAQSPKYFTFLTAPTHKRPRIVLGDARLSLKSTPDRGFNLIILDAYSSDAIPVHLITREAIRLYQRKLTNNGIMIFHISNRHLNLEPVLANLAQIERLSGLVKVDVKVTPEEQSRGKSASIWVFLSKSRAELASFNSSQGWRQLKPDPAIKVWTDDYSSVLPILHWR